MNSGMYSALSGSLAAMKRQDVISNNLANTNTPGYKKDKMLFESMLAGEKNPLQVPEGSTADPLLQKSDVYIDYSPGNIAQTGNNLDFAISGDGFFVISTPDGQAYTRQGNFRLAGDGTLVTVDGMQVMGQNGPIRINGGVLEIDDKGVIKVDGTAAGTLSVVDFQKPYNMTKKANAQFVPASAQDIPQPVAAPSVLQGHLEGSNVEAVTEMVEMIETTRYYEACAKVIRAYDDITAKATTEIGRV